MVYKKLICRSYKIIETIIWLLPVVNSSRCKSWNITKHDHRIHHIYHTHHILWQYHIINTPCKNKLDTSNLFIAYFMWLMGATLKNGSYLCKATMFIMVANIRCKSHDYYSERNWHPPATYMEQATRQVQSRSRKQGHVKLAWTALISLCRAIRNTQHRGLQQKISMPSTILLRFTRVKHLRIDLALIPLKGFAA
jgi:hypothetical protein